MNFDTIKTMFSAAADRPQMQSISGSSAVQLHSDPDTIFIDVRGQGEISASGTIQGAIIAPLPEFKTHAQADGSASLPAATEGKRIICVCASGARSGSAAQHLLTLGYSEVANLSGGIGAWMQAGGPVQR